MKEQNLQLSLIEESFIMTKSGMQQADYRDITPYWCNRLLLVDGKPKSKKWWQEKFNYSGNIFADNTKWIIENIQINNFSFKPFAHNIMTLGYPKSTDSDRILKIEHKGIEIRTGNPLLGAEPNKLYFVIKHGEIL